jgi:integrase
MRRYKTFKTYGEQTLNVPPRLVKVLKGYVKDRDLKEGDYLFPSKNGKPYSNFSGVLKDAFHPVNVTANSLRHSYISNFLSKTRSEADRAKAAAAMGQSLNMQSKYLRMELIED